MNWEITMRRHAVYLLVPVLLFASVSHVSAADAPAGYVIVEGDILVPESRRDDFVAGTYEVELWPGGIVPYEFVTGSAASVDILIRSDVSFVAGNPPRIQVVDSTSVFPVYGFTAGEELVVLGSTNNDNSVATAYIITNVGWTWLELRPTDPIVNEAAGASVMLRTTENVPAGLQALMIGAMTDWEAVANVDFRPRNSEATYIRIRNHSGNSAPVGRQDGVVNIVNMATWGEDGIHTHTKHHELGHALGYRHEHTRPDRDLYVTIMDGSNGNPDYISTTACSGDSCHFAFAISPTADGYPITGFGGAEYDFGSVMHYRHNAFSIADTLSTIVLDPPWNQDPVAQGIGQRDSLSHWDAKVMSFLYPEGNWVFLHASSPDPNTSGTFLEPHKSWDTALAAVPTAGRIIVLYPNTYVAPGTYTKAVTVEAPVGGVILR